METAVVTGIGLVTALGFGREKTWQAILNGQSGIRPDPLCAGYLTAPLPDFYPPAETRLLSMAFLAAAEALYDSSIDMAGVEACRRGCTVSVSKPNLASARPNEIQVTDLFMPDTLGRQLATIFKLAGPVRNIAAACATGTDSIIMAADWIRHGLCDMVLAGAVESSLHPLYQAGFGQMGVLAARCVRPFDRHREGFALGEGAGILVVERKDAAIMRGAHIYGAIAGGTMANDVHHPIAFEPSGATIATALRATLAKAGLGGVDYINAHGTATKLNDIIETRAIKTAFGAHAKDISISSTKAATGHLLGASGAVECALALLAMRDNVVPPTLNLCAPDDECDLDYTPAVARQKKLESVMSLSFGFGGQIGIIAAVKQ
jgi:3-oxoacyl-[acyl-carrier-protein] synthase II